MSWPKSSIEVINFLCGLPHPRMVDVSERTSLNPHNGRSTTYTNVTGGTDKIVSCHHCDQDQSKHVHIVASWRQGLFSGMEINGRKYKRLKQGMEAAEAAVQRLYQEYERPQ